MSLISECRLYPSRLYPRFTVYVRHNSLISSFKYCSEDVKMLLLFKIFCSTLYGSALWCNSKFNRMKVAISNIFRKLFSIGSRDSISYNMIFRNMDPFPIIIRGYVFFSFSTRLEQSHNDVLSSLFNWFTFTPIVHLQALVEYFICKKIL